MTVTASQPFRPLSAEAFAALRADIAANGVLVPIEVDEDGRILDGHHRKAIATELGIECPEVVRTGLDDDAKTDRALKLNLLRRHLTPAEWGEVFGDLLEQRGISRGPGPKRDHATVAQTAAEFGVPLRTAQHRMALADDAKPAPKTTTDTVRLAIRRCSVGAWALHEADAASTDPELRRDWLADLEIIVDALVGFHEKLRCSTT